MALHEWPLILFTVLAQTSVGAFLLLGALILSGKLDVSAQSRLTKSLFFIWVLMGLGFVFSTAHLGSPHRALNALNRVGSSWLSNEIFTGSLFFAAGGVYWLLAVFDKGTQKVRNLTLAAAMVIGVVFMYSMIQVYLIDTVPTWDNVYTSLNFVMTMLVSGIVFAHLLLTIADHPLERLDKLLTVVGAVAISASLVVMFSQSSSLAGIHSAVISGSELVPALTGLQLIRICLLVVALAVWFVPRLTNRRPALPVMIVSFSLIFLSELVGRGGFYGLHMTVGL